MNTGDGGGNSAAASMQSAALTLATSLCLTAAAWPQLAVAQDERDFVFTDVEGHMVLRFAGGGQRSLDPDQMEEIINVSLSTMVHDRLRADAAFEAEPADSVWADSMTPKILGHLSEAGPEFSAIDVECRSATCRLVLEHADRRSVAGHQALMGIVQLVIQAFIETDPASFDPVFLITAYNQDAEIPHIKAFLRRAT